MVYNKWLRHYKILGNVISVELSVACNIYIALEKRKGAGAFQMSAAYML